VHGFRDWAAERTNFPSEVADMALAHTVSSKVEQAYRRGDMFERRRRMMAAWANVLRHRAGGITEQRRTIEATSLKPDLRTHDQAAIGHSDNRRRG
jgi:hypothetical protein